MSEVRKIQIQDGKGNIYHPQTVSEQVLDLDKRLEGLAKETYVDEKIAAIPEVDLTDIENNILTLEDNKADKTDMDSKLSLKADKTDMDFNLSLKADKTDMDSKLSLKADKTELSEKADKSELTPINNDILRLEENKADMSEVETRLSLKTDQAEFEDLQDKSLTFDMFSHGVITSYTYSFDIEGKGVIFLLDKVNDRAISNLEIDGKSIGNVLRMAEGDVILEEFPVFLPFYKSAKGSVATHVKVLLI